MIVVDASVMATALGDDAEDGVRMRARLTGEMLFAPELIDLEVLSVWRRQTRRGALSSDRVRRAVVDLATSPLRRRSHRALLPRCWELSETVTPYDAAYVALAEWLDVPLLTADARLAGASGPRCQVEVVA